MIIAITGPTCSGKTTVMNYICEKYKFKKLVTYTTREPRPGEVNGVDYHFVSEKEFRGMITSSSFIEWTRYTGNRLYGSLGKDFETHENIVCVLTPSGVRRLRDYIGQNFDHAYDLTTIYVETDLDVITKRFIKRCVDDFTLTDLEELHNRSERDFGMFDGWEYESDYFLGNNYEDEDGLEKLKKEVDEIFEDLTYIYGYKFPSNQNSNQNQDETEEDIATQIKTIYVDFDNTLVNTTQRIVDMYNEDYQYYKKFKKIKPEEIQTYGFKECECASEEAINQYFNSKRFFDELDFMDNADEILELFHYEQGYNITVVSMGYSPNLKGKEEWVRNNLPFANFIGCNLKEVKDKSHIDMSDGILIDDTQKMLDTSNAIVKIPFDPSNNKEWKTIGRLIFYTTTLDTEKTYI